MSNYGGSKKTDDSGSDLSKKSNGKESKNKNQGEGDKNASRRFNRASREFLNSDKGEECLDEIAKNEDDKDGKYKKAEERALSRAKEHDRGESIDYNKSN